MDLRTARFKKNLTQYDLKIKTGIHQSKLSLIERGYIKPNKDEVRRLAKVLGVKANDLSWNEDLLK